MLPAIGPVPDKLADAWDAVKDVPKIANTTRALDTVGAVVSTTQNNATPFIPIIKATAAAAAQSDIGKVMKEGINKFSEGIPLLMSALDELKTLHPFLGVVVVAFKTVYIMEQKRHDNDKKIILLYTGMKDMMGVLLLFKDVKNDKLVAPDGTIIEDRLKSLVESTADNIKTCSNVCDAYMKKRFLAKVLLSSVWDTKLLAFVKLFATRRQEFEFELTIHTSQAVDKANIKLGAIGDSTKELKEQMDVIKALLEQLVSPEQKRLSDLVKAKGGANVYLNNDKMLLDLEKIASKASSSPSVEGRTRQAKQVDTNLEVVNLRQDIWEDPDAAAERNWNLFLDKFEAQKNQIVNEVSIVIKRSTDRVIGEVRGKAQERIRDQSIHDLWVEMGWRGNVKARHFVLALRDYYLDKLALEADAVPDMDTSAIHNSTDPDAWAIKYIDVMWVQPILEAFDDDASGFITVAEVNRFTSSRPVDWSLPHWLAFWAVGFKWSIIDYAYKIEVLFAKMAGLRSFVLPPNREAVDRYMTRVWESIHPLTAAVLSQYSWEYSWSEDTKKFKSYLEAQEARLGNHLRAVHHVIDGVDTLPLIAGVGRIEKTVFPLLYLLMKHHYEIMRIMRTKILSMGDLEEGSDGIRYIEDAIKYRVEDLAHNFSQQRLDPEKQFQTFVFGIFKYYHNEKSLWTVDYIRSLDPEVIPYYDDSEDQTVQPGDVLNPNRGYKDERSLDYSVYDDHPIDYANCGDVGLPMKDIFGYWSGYTYDYTDGYLRGNSMMTFVLLPTEGEHDFKGDFWSLRGHQTIAGSWSKNKDDVTQLTFEISFSSELRDPITFYWLFDPERDVLHGCWVSADFQCGKIEFRRIPPRYLTVYPSIKELSDDKPRALWRFAIAAVRNDIRRDHWTWSYFSQRRDDRETIIPLLVRDRWFGVPLNDEEKGTLDSIAARLMPGDACFYNSRVDYIRSHTCIHDNAWCDSCKGRIGGPRLICLDCTVKSTEIFNSVEVCCAPQCVGARITDREDLESAHEPSHRLVKFRTTVVKRSHGRTYIAACDAFERVSETQRKIVKFTPYPDEETGPDEQNTSPTSTEMHAESDKPDDLLNPPDGPNGVTEVEGESARDAREDQVGDESLPTCGKCEGRLSFPFWYCIICEDDLYICDGCDAKDVPDLMRSSGQHTEEHHLIRCLAPEGDIDKAPPTEDRLTSIETRLDGMQTQLDDLKRDLTGRMGDLKGDLTGYIGDLNARIGNIEQLLHRLVGAPEGRTP